MQLNLKNENVFLVKAYSWQALKKYKLSLAEFTKAISINPENSISYYHRGFVYNQLNNKSAARLDFSKARTLGMKESSDAPNEFEPE